MPAAGRRATLVDAWRGHARALGCERELALVAHLAGHPGSGPPPGRPPGRRPGATRQRAIASEPAGLPGLVDALAGEFSPPPAA